MPPLTQPVPPVQARALPRFGEAPTLYAVALGLAVVTLVWPLYLWGDVFNYRENGPVEGPQSVYLLLATVLFVLALRRPEPLTRLEVSGIAVFCLNLLLRETDPRGTWAEPGFGWLFLHGRMFYIPAVLWLVVIGFVLPRFKVTVADMLRWLRTPAGLAMMLGCVFYVVADRAEKHGIFRDPERSESLEETLELYGCYFIFLSGWLTTGLSAVAAGFRSAPPAGTGAM